MLEMFLRAFETLFVSLIIGGGVIMAACVRPFLLHVLSGKDKSPELISTVESISIQAWSRYNRYAFFSSLSLLLLEGIRIFTESSYSYWHIGIVGVIILAFIRKFAIDHQLSSRLQKNGSSAVGSIEQNMGHRQVELLSKIILLLAVIVAILPH